MTTGIFQQVGSKGSDDVFGFAQIMREVPRVPNTPASGYWKSYFKSSGLFFLEDDGTEYQVATISSGLLVATKFQGNGLILDQVAAPVAPTDGEVWHDQAQNDLMRYTSGREIRSHGTLYSSYNILSVKSTASETSIIPAGSGSLTLPANFLVLGRSLRITLRGIYRTKAAPIGTLQIRVKIGSTTILDTGAQTPGVASIADFYWEISALYTQSTVGASGIGRAQGHFDRQETNPGAPVRWQMKNSTSVASDTTAARTIDVTAQWATADINNEIETYHAIVEMMN